MYHRCRLLRNLVEVCAIWPACPIVTAWFFLERPWVPQHVGKPCSMHNTLPLLFFSKFVPRNVPRFAHAVWLFPTAGLSVLGVIETELAANMHGYLIVVFEQEQISQPH